MKEAPRILIAGVGNVLRGDDGFGVVTAQRLMSRTDLPPTVKVIETGIGGMSLVHELMDGYDALLLLDACKRGGQPGQLYLLEPVVPDAAGFDLKERRAYFADTHYATPTRALALISAVASLPRVVRVLGCEPEIRNGLVIGLSPRVAAAVAEAVDRAIKFVTTYSASFEAQRVKQ